MSGMMPTQAYLKECFLYLRDTGQLVWQERPRSHFPTEHGWRVFNGAYAGRFAGTLDDHGYLQVGINGTLYRNHRIVWKYLHGTEPQVIDHINHDRLCNLESNLRSVSHTENLANRNPLANRAERQSGVPGVTWSNRDKKWLANHWDGKKLKYLGRSSDLAEAIAILKSATGV